MTPFEEVIDLERRGRFADAFALLESCSTDPSLSRSDVLFHCGWCIEQQEGCESSRALDFYEQSVAAACDVPCAANAAFRAGWIRMHMKDYDGALEMFRKIVDEAGVDPNQTVTDAVFWSAVCLEAESRYLEAIDSYENARSRSGLLDPECRVRQLYCLLNVGDFGAALALCDTFKEAAPADFPPLRYADLAATVRKEKEMLETCRRMSMSSWDVSVQ